MKAKFSVIVPVYKVEEYLKKCVDSILNQTFQDFELILVDDGSPDFCPQMCDAYANADSRVRVVHKPNGGLVSARNAGIAVATGDYICYVDGDDWIDQRLLEVVYTEAIEQHAPDMVIFGFSRVFDDRTEEYKDDLPSGLYDKKMLNEQVCPYMMCDNRKPFCKGLIFPVAWNKIYRKEFLLEHYCRDKRIRMGEDNAFVYECVWYSERIYICNQTLYFYNQLNAGSMVHSYDAGRFENNQFLTSYLERRLVGKDVCLDKQINAFKAYWLIMAVFHEVKNDRPLNEAARHIKSGIAQTSVLDGIRRDGLPLIAVAFLLLLHCRLYRVALVAAKVVNRKRENRDTNR